MLFSDVASPDVCTDPSCFAEKKERVWKLRVTKAKDEGQEVMTKKEAKQVFGISGQVSSTCGYVELSDRCEADPKGRTFKKLLGRKLPSVTIARDEAGRVRELVKATEVHDALAAAGHKIEVPKPLPVQDPEDAKEERRKAQEREQKKRELVAATIPLAVEQLVESGRTASRATPFGGSSPALSSTPATAPPATDGASSSARCATTLPGRWKR